MADVSFNGTTFTGNGTYDQAVNETVDLTVTPDSGATITFSNNFVTTGNVEQTTGTVVFGAAGEGTVNSIDGNLNVYGANSTMNLYGNMTVGVLNVAKNGKNASVNIYEGSELTVTKVSVNNINNTNTQGSINQYGGTVTCNTVETTGEGNFGIFKIGHWNAGSGCIGEYNLIGGTLSVPNAWTFLGWDGYGRMNISGGEATLMGISLSNNGTGKGYLTLTGGTLNLGSSGVVYCDGRRIYQPTAKNGGTPDIKLGQGTVNATESHTWASNIPITLNGRAASSTADVAGGVTTFNANTGKTITIAGVVSGVGALTKTGTGTLTLSNANTYTGGTTVQNGVLMLTKGGSSGSLYKGTNVTVNGSNAVLAGNGDAGGNGDVFGYGANSVGRINLNNGGALTNDSSTWHITVGAVIYMNDGKINTTDPSAAGSEASGNFVFDNAIYVTAGTNNEISVQRFTIRHLVNTPYASGDDGGVFDVAQSAQLTISSIIIDKTTASGTTVPLIKRGAGTLTLSGANTYTTGTTISDGTLKLTGAGTLGTGAVTNSGTLEFAHTDDITFSNVISGSGAVTKTGTGTLTLSGANAYTGGTTISNGTLKLINDALENAQGEFTVGENGTLEFYVAEGTKELSLSAQNELFITGKVIKTGAGELKIDAADPGSIDAQSFVISSGRVDIKTYFDGQLEVKNGATFSPGNSVGPLTIDGQGVVVIGESTYGDGFILNEEGATLLMEIGGSDVTDNDVLIVQNGNILLGNGIIELAMTDDCPLGLGESFTAVLSAENSDEGLDVLGHIQTSDFTDLKYELISDATYGNVYAITGRRFNANEVPEPSTWALLLLGAAGLLYVRKRTRK